jgi:hypothetical protein
MESLLLQGGTGSNMIVAACKVDLTRRVGRVRCSVAAAAHQQWVVVSLEKPKLVEVVFQSGEDCALAMLARMTEVSVQYAVVEV